MGVGVGSGACSSYEAALGWALGCYRFERYRSGKDSRKELLIFVTPRILADVAKD